MPVTTTVYVSKYEVGADLSAFQNLDVTSTGSIGKAGVFAQYYTTVINDGRVTAGRLGSRNYNGVFFDNPATLINGSPTYAGALISGLDGVYDLGGAATVTNYGTIRGVISVYGSTDGLLLKDGGSLVNGSTADQKALVEGAKGVDIGGAAGAVTNYGTIVGQVNQAVVLYNGGNVTNGAVTDTSATVTGVHQGVGLVDVATITNFGVISGTGAAPGDVGIQLNSGGRLANGTAGDPGAAIEGYTGALLTGPGTVANYGTITGLGAGLGEFGVYLTDGGRVINGAGTDRSALIDGAVGIKINGAPGVIMNAGTILARETDGADLLEGGSLTNGSLNDKGALIQGSNGVALIAGAGTNFGTIASVGDNGVGALLLGGAALTNGALGDAGALIEGAEGVYAGPSVASTVTNFGTIQSAGGDAVEFMDAGDVLNVEAGSTIKGVVAGGGGKLVLASGTGTLVGLLGSAGDVTVSGAVAPTTFTGFDAVEVGAGAKFTDSAAVTIAASRTVEDAGTLTLGGVGAASIVNDGLIETSGSGVLDLAGAVLNSGTLAVGGGTLTAMGVVTGAGKVTIDGGTADFDQGFGENVDFTGTKGVLELAHSQTYAGKITGLSKTGTSSLELEDIDFADAPTWSYSGTTTSGVLTVEDSLGHVAKITLEGDYVGSSFVLSAGPGTGTKVVDPKIGPPGAAPLHQFIAAAASFAAPAGGLAATAEAWRPPAILAAPHSG